MCIIIKTSSASSQRKQNIGIMECREYTQSHFIGHKYTGCSV